jgi:hypothetical protein
MIVVNAGRIPVVAGAGIFPPARGNSVRRGSLFGLEAPMAHIHEHRPRRHDSRAGHIRRRPVKHPDDEHGLLGEFGEGNVFHGNGSILGRRRHGGLGNGDARAMGASFQGRGPKGYSRSDDRIREDVCERLIDDPHLDASAIDVAVESGDVTLTGTVDSRRSRQHAEDLAGCIRGVKGVHSSLGITLRPSRPS